MPDGVLPALLVLLEIRKLSGDVGIDLAEGRPLLRAMLNRHGDQGDVAEGRFAVGGGAAGAVVRAGRGGRHGAVRGSVGCGRCGRCRGIAVSGAMKGAHRRRALVVQVMMRCDRGVHGHHDGVGTVLQVVMRMVVA